ncbi:MAG TPA: hypothetical protein VEC37_12400, partial [Bacillota bacterium]|nr:hypothetical protein [Bacillota bacterium]
MTHTNFFILTCLICLGISLSGCEKFIERDNPTATTDDRWWVNQSQLNNALNPLYLGLPAGITTYDRDYSNVRSQLSGITDDALFRSNYMDFEIFTLGTATSSSSIPLAYYKKYSLIRSASRFLEHYQKAYVPDPGLKE